MFYRQGRYSYLVIDVGTTTIKFAIINENKKILLTHFVRFNYSIKPYSDELKKIVIDSIKKIKNKYKKIDGIAISGNGPTLIPFDKDMQQVGEVITWTENTAKIDGIESIFLNKVNEFKKNYETEYNKTAIFLTPNDYIAYLFTGKKFTSIFDKSFEQYYWTKTEIKKLGLDENKFSEFKYFGEIIGKVENEIETDTEILVYASSVDYVVALLGSNATLKIPVNRTGTGESLTFLVDKQIDGAFHFYNKYWTKSKFVKIFSGREFDKIFTDENFSKYSIDENIKNILNQKFYLYQNQELSLAAYNLLTLLAKDFKRVVDEFRADGFKFSKVIINGGQSYSKNWLKYKGKVANVKFIVNKPHVPEFLGNLYAILQMKKNLLL